MTPKYAVYRLFDPAGALLYVGMSQNVWARLETHRAKQPWSREITKAKIAVFKNYDDMCLAEKMAIREERPIHNKVRYVGGSGSEPRHGLGITRTRTFRIPNELWRAAKDAAAFNGETVTDVIRRELINYANEP